MKAESFLPG